MTFRTAKEQFEKALQIAEQEGDSYREFIAAGLVDLAKALQAKFTETNAKLDGIKSKI